eukprot:s7_g25.t1
MSSLFRAFPELRLQCLSFLGPADLGKASCLDRSCAALATSDTLRLLAFNPRGGGPARRNSCKLALWALPSALHEALHKLDRASASAEEIEVSCPIKQFALLIEIRLRNQEVLSQVVEMNVDTEEPETLKADLGRVASLVPLPVGEEEATELSLSATLIRKSDGALKTPAALVSTTHPGHYWFDLFVSLTDRRDAVASLDTLQIQQLDVDKSVEYSPLPIKNVLACWAELGDWMHIISQHRPPPAPPPAPGRPRKRPESAGALFRPGPWSDANYSEASRLKRILFSPSWRPSPVFRRKPPRERPQRKEVHKAMSRRSSISSVASLRSGHGGTPQAIPRRERRSSVWSIQSAELPPELKALHEGHTMSRVSLKTEQDDVQSTTTARTDHHSIFALPEEKDDEVGDSLLPSVATGF